MDTASITLVLHQCKCLLIRVLVCLHQVRASCNPQPPLGDRLVPPPPPGRLLHAGGGGVDCRGGIGYMLYAVLLSGCTA